MRALIFVLTVPQLISAQCPGSDQKLKFTISKETTYLTSPLDRDGYIDYVTALNERLGKSVKPADNANVLLCQVFGPRPDGAHLPANYYKRMGTQEPPEIGKYFTEFRPYAKVHHGIDVDKEGTRLLEEEELTTQRLWTTKQFLLVAGWLDTNKQPLDLAVQGIQRPKFYYPLVPGKNHLWQLGNGSSPWYRNGRELSQALVARALLQAGEGRNKEAWQDLLACHRLGRFAAAGGLSYNTLFGSMIDSRACLAELGFLDGAKLNATQIKACLRDLQELPPMPSFADLAPAIERYILLDMITRFDKQGIDVFAAIKIGVVSLAEAFPKKMDLSRNETDEVLRTVNIWFDRLDSALLINDRGERNKQLAKLQYDQGKLGKPLLDPERLVWLLDGKQSPNGNRGKLFGEVLVFCMLPGTMKFSEAADRTEQTRRNLLAAFALNAYRQEHGSYPKKLEALVPKYLTKVPLDLYSDKSIKYQPTAQGFMLYSVGPNGKDEKGNWLYDFPSGDDLTVRMPLPELNKD